MHTPETRPSRMKLAVNFGADHFSLDGEFTLAEATASMKGWNALRGDQADKAQIEKLTGEIDEETKKDTAALATPTT